MPVSENRKIGQHFDYKIPIVVSPFNSKDFRDALLVDHNKNGITFISKNAFSLKTAVLIRVKDSSLKGSRNREVLSLPSIRIGEVKKCTKYMDDASPAYEIGVNYYYNDY
ncbi:MAG: hypothetical protein AB7S77_13520 [Desulfatirhabdiaceae bacterium]